MHCPKCKYEPTLAEHTNNKDQCPSCGIFYSKYLAQMKARENNERADPRPAAAIKSATSKKAALTVAEAQPVVVVDIQMRFWSMVVFMVKWAFAAIPALIIIGVIITMITMFSAGLIAGIGSGSKSISGSPMPSKSPSATYEEPKLPDKKEEQEDLITAELLGKGFSSENYTDSITLQISFENKTGRDIRAFEGAVVLSDLLGNQIKRVRLSDSEPRWSGNNYLWNGTIRYNQFIQEDIELRNTSLDALNMDFEVQKILYADGVRQEF